jgi:hypothetical protein
LKGQRVGFELITLDGRSGLLAHVDPAQIEGTTRSDQWKSCHLPSGVW